MKVGDLITSYHKGIHRITEIKPFEYGELVTYEKIFNDNMTPSSKRINQCNMAGCKKVTGSELSAKLEEMKLRYHNVIHFVNSLERQPIPEYGDHMTMKVFQDDCRSSGLMDYDGYGRYATETEMTNSIIMPSDFLDIKDRLVDKSFTHVVWFNK